MEDLNSTFFGLQDDAASGFGDENGGGEYASVDVPLTVFRLLVCVAGIIGNALVIFVILVLREYEKAVTHWYVLQLAIADMLFLMTIPFKVAEDINDEWTYSEGFCKIKEATLFFNYYSSILFLTIMGLDRYVAVCHAHSAGLQKLRTKRAAYLAAAVVWVSAALLCIPILLYSHKKGTKPHCKCQYHFPKYADTIDGPCGNETEQAYQECMDAKAISASAGWCTDAEDFAQMFSGIGLDLGEFMTEADASVVTESATVQEQGAAEEDNLGCTYETSGPGWTAFLSFNFVVMFLLPLIVMSVCYTMIILRLRKTLGKTGRSEAATTIETAPGSRKAKKRRTKSAASMKAEKNRSRVTVVCGALVILFVVCWLPYHAINLAKMKGIKGSVQYCLQLTSIASLLAFVNSALNPYLYNFIGTSFAKRVRKALGSVRKQVEKSTSTFSSSGRVRYNVKKHSESTENTGTVSTKIYMGKHTRDKRPESSSGNEGIEMSIKQSSFEQEPLVDFKISSTPEKTLINDDTK